MRYVHYVIYHSFIVKIVKSPGSSIRFERANWLAWES